MGRHKKTKQSNFIWFIILIIFCVFIYLIYKDKNNIFKTTTTTNVPATSSSKPINFETRNIKDEKDRYIINISYPYFNIKFVDDNIKNFIDNTIIDFKKDMSEFQNSDNKQSLDVVFEPHLISNQLISLQFISSIYAGGVHGSQQVITKNFNLNTKQEIKLNNLFKNDDYINYLSNKAISKFLDENISEEDWINNGAGPKYSNFENFTYSKDANNLIFHFNPYQIAPYSEGIIKFEIPISELQKYMKP